MEAHSYVYAFVIYDFVMVTGQNYHCLMRSRYHLIMKLAEL